MKRVKMITGIAAATAMLAVVDFAPAAILTWDADGVALNAGFGGSGNWNTTSTNKVWYDGINDVAWTANNEAVFGGTAGAVTVSSSPSPSKLTINTDGFSFYGNLATAAAGSSTDAILINGNVQFNGSLSPGTNVNTVIASGKTMTLANGGSLRRTTGGSVSLTGGNLGIGLLVLNSAVTQTGGTASASLSSQTPSIGNGATGSWTLSHSSAAMNLSGGTSLEVGRSNSGNGTLTMNAGSVSVTGGSAIRIGAFNGTGAMYVAGGDLTVSGAGSVLYIADSGSGNGTLAVSSGTATVEAIQFGRTGQTPSGVGTLTVSGGSLYVGSGGIALGSLAANKAAITFSGGTLGAVANWSSSMAITLSGATTIKAADASDLGRNISLSGNVGGAGSLTKTGSGKLTLGSATYSGATQVTAGILEVNGTVATSSLTVSGTAALHGTGSITNGVVIDGTAAPAGASIGKLKVGSATFGEGSTLEINLGAAGQSDTLAVTGALDITDATLSLSGAGDSSTYVIATYGTLTGEFVAPSVLPDGYEINFGTGENSAITLVAVPEPAMGLFLPGVALVLGRRHRRQQ